MSELLNAVAEVNTNLNGIVALCDAMIKAIEESKPNTKEEPAATNNAADMHLEQKGESHEPHR